MGKEKDLPDDIVTGDIVLVNGWLTNTGPTVGVLTNTGVFIPINNVVAMSVSSCYDVGGVIPYQLGYSPYNLMPEDPEEYDKAFPYGSNRRVVHDVRGDVTLDLVRAKIIDKENVADLYAKKRDDTMVAIWLE
jgi:hypothetical protein